MKSSLARITGSIAAAATIGSVAAFAPPTAVASPGIPTAAGSPATSVPAGERNKRVSRSLTGVRPSAYVGKYFSTRYEATRRCIVRKESGGNYRVASSSGRYRGAYQFNSDLARSTARRMGRSDLVNSRFNTWSRFEQDKAFWIVWNHGRGRGNWPTARGC